MSIFNINVYEAISESKIRSITIYVYKWKYFLKSPLSITAKNENSQLITKKC